MQSEIRVNLFDVDVDSDAIAANMRCALHYTILHPLMKSCQKNVEEQRCIRTGIHRSFTEASRGLFKSVLHRYAFPISKPSQSE